MNWFLVFTCIACSFFCLVGQGHAQQTPFTVTLTPPSQTVHVGNNVVVNISIENTSKKSLNFVTDPNNSEISNIVYVWLQNGVPAKRTPYGRAIYEPDYAKAHTELLSEGSPRGHMIPPGGHMDDAVTLNKSYDLNSSGTYLVKVTRRWPLALGNGTVQSNQVTVTVSK